MRRSLALLSMTLILPVLLASLLFAGCGSADDGDYLQEVSTLNRETAEKLEESVHLLGESGHGEEEAGTEAVVLSLEETVLVMEEALAELEEIKVPAGWEEYHRELTAFYHANLAAYQGYLAALAPAEEPAEGEHEEEEGADTHDEETVDEEEAPHEEETPQPEEEPAESGGH